MVPREFRKSLCIIAGLITLLEAVIWGAASIYVIGTYNCVWDFINSEKGVSVWSMLIITYLMGGCSGSDGVSRLGYSKTFIPPADAATSLQVWLWANAILSAIWIPTCVLLIVVVLVEVKGKNGALLYYPWQAFTVILSVFDFAGAIYHAVDIFQTTTPDSYAKFTSKQSWDKLTIPSPKEGVLTWLPSLLVTLFFCRFMIIWVINIIFLVTVCKASNAVSSYKTKNLQTTQQNSEEIKSWRDMFYNSSDPIWSENFQTQTDNQIRNTDYVQQQSQQVRITSHPTSQESPRTTHKIEETGKQSEECTKQYQRSNIEDNQPRSPYRQKRNIGYSSRPETPDSFNEHWQDIPPPIAGEVTVPPELSRVRPFSYTAGDQPQLMKANISRSNSRAEYPHIPQPDYTIAERRAASLEYIPNRFKVPSPKRTTQQLNYDKHSPTYSKQPPLSQKTPQGHKRPLPTTVEVGYIPRSKFNPDITNTRQTSNMNEYNINKLY